MVAPGSGAGPKTSFSTVTAQGSHAVHTAPNRTPPGLPTTPVFLPLPTPCLNQAAVQAPARRDQPAFPLLSSNHGHQRFEEPSGPGRGKHPFRRKDDGIRHPLPPLGV